MPKRLERSMAFMALLFVVLPVSAAFPKSRQVTFSLGPVGTAVQDSELLVAARLNNTSDRIGYRIRINSIRLESASTVTPTSFPVIVGQLDPGANAVIQSRFDSSNLMPGQQYLLQMEGSYRPVDKGTQADHGHVFTVTAEISLPPPVEGSATLMTATAPANMVSGAPFGPVPVPYPNFEEANPPGPPVPIGPHVMLPNAVPSPSVVEEDAPVVFTQNSKLNLISNISTTAEPSGASDGDGVVFATANWTAAYSTDGGTTFTQLNPTTIFPNDAIGYCCDQVVQYVASASQGRVPIDRFIWLLQGSDFKGYRLAEASPAQVSSSGGTAWTYWNLSRGFFGYPTGKLDYPDMSVGNNYLYLSFDKIGTGLMVVRIPLGEIAAGGTIHVQWTDPANGATAYGGHITQDTGNEVFWAGHNSTSQMRIFSLAEGSDTYYWRSRNIGSWSNTGLVSTTPDGKDWMTKLRDFPGNAVLGATRAPLGDKSNGLWFAWSAGTDSNFPRPHVEMVTFDRSDNFKLLQQVQIWNSSYAFAYPALATNRCTGEVGFSLEGGGVGNYENNLVGFWGDFLAYITTASNVGTTRFGDYVTIRQDPGPNYGAFDALGYGLNTPPAGQSGTRTDVRYIVFGRSCQIE